MHKLLARQIRASKRADGSIDADVLIGIIDQAYEELDRERRLNDRAARLMEDELIAANEHATREHNAVLATILESAPDGMLVTMAADRIETANAAAEKQFGAQPGELVGRKLSELLPVGGIVSDGDRSKRSDHRLVGDASAVRLGGECFPVEYSICPMGTGSCIRNLWIIRDISERIRIQREILESQMRFQDFAEASSDCFWELDKNLANLKATSPGSIRNTASVVRVLTQGYDALTPGGSHDKNWVQIHAALTAHEPFRDKRVTTLCDDGQKLCLSVSGKPLFNSDGYFEGYRGTARNVTEEVLARDAARRAQRRMIDAMNVAPNAIALVDAAMNYVAGNSALAALAPSAAKDLQTGKSFPRFLEKAFTTEGKVHNGMTPAELIHRIMHDGKHYEIRAGEKWLLIAGRTISDHGAVLTFSDVTEIKERERELAEAKKAAESANRLKSQFLATMSHELRTPLNAILGFSEVIRDQILGKEDGAWKRYVEYASSIYASGRHLLALISEILDLSKIEAGTYFLDPQKINMNALVQETVALIKPTAGRAGVEIKMSLPNRPVTLRGDDRALRQIALNLLSNATKFTPRNGRVDVVVEADEENMRLIVQDTGIGIAEADQASVFEPFTQVDSSVRRRHEGTGLGLAITKRLVEMHGGTIALTSQLDVGTKLVVTLPLRQIGEEDDQLAEAAA